MDNSFIDKYDLFIFDLDDTLVKTEHLHYKSWLNILQKNINKDFFFDYNYYCSKFHSKEQDFIKNYLINELKLKNYEELILEKNNYYLNLIIVEKPNFKLLDGCFVFLENILKNKKQFVIVSNNLKKNIDFFSDLFPILKNSSKNYYREILINKKPHPECYLKVIEDFPNKRMLGFEDSITGIHAICSVSIIDTIFINNNQYYYYNYIIQNYKLKLIIKDFKY